MTERIGRMPMRRMAVYAGVLFALSLLPILMLGRYNVMCVDDYDYGRAVHDVWLETGSLWQSVRAAWRQNMAFYRDWQGTYVSCFLMALCPMNFDYGSAYVVPVLMLGMSASSAFALGRHILCRWMGAEKAAADFVMFMLLFMFYQVMEAPYEGIYWYNGATHYVLMESFFFFGLTAVLAALRAQEKSAEALWCALAAVLAVIVGGGNLVTGLQAEIVMTSLLLYAIAVNREKIIAVAVPFAAGTIGFLFNILAPGNLSRSSQDMDAGYPAVASVLLSFYHAVVFIIRWTPAFVLVIWLLLLPVMWRIAKRSGKRFGHPVWVTWGAFCLISAMFTPTLYAIGMVGLSRVDNIIQMVYYLCLIMVTTYWLGYFARREDTAGTATDTEAAAITAAATKGAGAGDADAGMIPGTGHRQAAFPHNTCAAELFGGFLEQTKGRLTAACFIITLVTWLLTADKNTYTSISALRSLTNGDAQTFYAEAMERHAVYVDEEIVDVELAPYSARPALFDFNDLTPDAENWLNLAVMQYYHKAYVKVAPE